jgi:hypothetical protein
MRPKRKTQMAGVLTQLAAIVLILVMCGSIR